jgi:hypothetical protein
VKTTTIDPRTATEIPSVGSIAATLFAVCLLTMPSVGDVPPHIRLQEVFDQAEYVIVGNVREAQIAEMAGTQTDTSHKTFRAILKCELQLKGNLREETVTIQCEWDQHTAMSAPPINLRGGEDIMAYVVRKDKEYTFANLWRPYEFVSRSAINVGSGNSLDFEQFLLRCVDDQNATNVCQSIKLLEEVGSTNALLRIDKLTQSVDMVVRGRAVAYCLAVGQGSGYLQKALDFLEASDPSDAVAADDLAAQKINEIQAQRVEVYRQLLQLKSPELLPALQKMLGNKSASIRKAAAISIRQVAERARENDMETSVAYMINCLDDSDATVRYFAAMTLNKVLGHPEIDGRLVNYSADDCREIVEAWKMWWQTEDAAKYKAAQSIQ